MTAKFWHLITGEYPPQSGGISDYTALLAAGLASGGDEVHVWSSASDGIVPAVQGVTVHRSAGHWSRRDLERLSDELNMFAAPRRLLVQHTPNTWGYKGLNLYFSEWLLKRKSVGDELWLMVHEPFYPWLWFDKPTRWLLAAGQRFMMRKLLAASSRVYISIPGWEKYLRPFEPKGRLNYTWLPIFSTIPIVDDERAITSLREKLAQEGDFIIGTFGTFGGAIGEMLLEILPALLLKRNDLVGLLLGRGGEDFAEQLLRSYPELEKRVVVPGTLDAKQISLHLQVCDVLVQPYPDGISSRRTSVMAGLSHGIPTVSNTGFLSESVWADTDCVAFTEGHNCSDFVTAVEALLSDSSARESLAARARAVYSRTFALENTLNMLRVSD